MSRYIRLSFALILCSFSLFCFAPSAFSEKVPTHLIDGVDTPYPAPLLMGISAWINSAPIKPSDLKGKVVLIEFWTSTCPYCKRALPYVNQWYNRYHDKGLLIIGIHSPKTEEEQRLSMVKAAVDQYEVRYPIALDNHFETWDNYHVEGWPAFYLIDAKGKVVYFSYGAQNYDVLENNIQFLLAQ